MAKNTKSGLGRGLDSLLGGYGASSASKTNTTETKKTEKPKEEAAATPKPAPSRDVIRIEDLSEEDREAFGADAYEGSKTHQVSKPKPATQSIASHPATSKPDAKPAAKTTSATSNSSLNSDDMLTGEDGVTIKGVVERPVSPAAKILQNAEKPAQTAPKPAQAEKRASESLSKAPKAPAVVSQSTKNEPPEKKTSLDEVPIELVKPNPDQPRTHFNKEELEELSASIQKDGLLQPILVREAADGYEIIAGERRWQACKLAKMKTVPVRIKEADDMKVLELALIENLQRSDLNPIEEAYGYKRMMERGNRTQSEVAAAVSKGRSTIANALRLLDLPEDAQQLLFEDKITAGHARAILSVPSMEGRKKLTEKLANEKLSVRETESLARLMAGRENKAASTEKKPPLPKFYKTAAKDLTAAFGSKVKVRSVNGKNKIEIEFKDEDDLRRIHDLLCKQDEQ